MMRWRWRWRWWRPRRMLVFVVVVLRLRIETSWRKTELPWLPILAARRRWRRWRTRWSRCYGWLRIVIIAGGWSCQDSQKEGENGENETRESHDDRYRPI